MKHFSWILLITFTLFGGLSGCGPSVKVDTNKLVQAFQGSPSKGDIEKAATAINSSDYAVAVAAFEKAIKTGGLTPEQKTGITDAITGMQMIASQNPNKYSTEVYQSLSDVISHLEGQEPPMKK